MIFSKVKLWLLFFSLLFIAPLIQAQTTPESSISLTEVYNDYFKPNREQPFLHLNKTKVIQGESLWFTAYVFSPNTSKPSFQTTNLHVNLYSEDGELLEAKTIFIENGKGEGFFDLKTKKYPSGRYLLRAFTKYQRNFKEDLSFRQGFRILDTHSTTDQKDENPKFDLQFLPEGGHLLESVVNRIGVKLIDETGRSKTFSEAYVTNTKGDTINSFKSNQFGLAKFDLYYAPEETYQINLKPDGADWITKTLQKPASIGVSLIAQNVSPQLLNVYLSTNLSSLELIGGKKFHIAFHQQGKMKVSSFEFPKTDTLLTIQASKRDLATGINTVSVFDEHFNPILERQFFHGENLKRIEITQKTLKVRQDSIDFELQTLNEHENFNISMSVLPATTVSYKPKHNIFSAFYLKPYIKGHLENGAYYFTDLENPEIQKDLDLLLLTQGWSKYEWKDIFKGKPNELYENEIGFTIKGQLNKRPRNVNQLTILSSMGMELVDIDEENKFRKTQLFLEEESKISFGILKGKKNRMIQPKLTISQFPLRDTKDTKIGDSDFYGLDHRIPKSLQSYELAAFSSLGEVLDSVMIHAETSQKELDYSNHKLFTDQTKITKKLADRYVYITDYINANGFYVDRNYGSLQIKSNRMVSINYNPAPTVELDGMILNSNMMPGSLDILLNIKTSDVEAITINKSGLGHGLYGFAGYIQIITKNQVGFGDESGLAHSNMQSYTVKNGFAKNKQFYTPLYLSYNDEVFKRYGVIDWFDHIHFPEGTNKVGLQTKRVNAAGQKLFIEGMAEDGSLISEILMLQP